MVTDALLRSWPFGVSLSPPPKYQYEGKKTKGTKLKGERGRPQSATPTPKRRVKDKRRSSSTTPTPKLNNKTNLSVLNIRSSPVSPTITGSLPTSPTNFTSKGRSTPVGFRPPKTDKRPSSAMGIIPRPHLVPGMAPQHRVQRPNSAMGMVLQHNMQRPNSSMAMSPQNIQRPNPALGFAKMRNHGNNVRNLGTEKEEKKKQQLHAYIAWMNSQLKRRPGSRMITDLTADMQNGVALIQLVEILSGESLHGNPCPTTIPEMRDNIDLVLQLMISKRIRMHQTNPRDIVEGNLKSIMRLILALAVHYKPNSVKQSAQQNLRTPAQQAVVAQVQNAAVALAETRKEVAGSGHKVRRPLDFSQRSDVPSDSDSSFRHYSPKMHRRRENLDGSYIGPQTTPQSIQGSPNNKYLPKSKSLDLNNAPASPNESGSDIDTNIQEVFQNLFDEHSGLTSDMQTTKGALLKLQELLLNGEPPEGSEDEDVDESLPIEGRTPDEKIVVLRNRLLHSEETCCDLRDELSRVKNECLELQGTKSGLQQRLNEQEKAFLQMKAELLRIGFTQQNLEAEKTDLQKSLNEKEMSLKDLKREMAHKDRLLEQLKLDLENEVKDKDMITRTLKGQLQELSEKLRRVGENEANLSSRVASQERMMAKLEGKIMRSHHEPGSLKPGNLVCPDEFGLVHESLRNLRHHLSRNDPQHRTLDKLEITVSNLMEKLLFSEQTHLRRHSVDSMLGHTRKPPLSSDHLDELNGRPHPKATKILYFTDRTVTPFMCTIPKNLGEITLGDFKQIHDKNKPGAYRYHFKALDPEFGTVKEEISNDDTILPGWEGKIVGWVEEDHG